MLLGNGRKNQLHSVHEHHMFSTFSTLISSAFSSILQTFLSNVLKLLTATKLKKSHEFMVMDHLDASFNSDNTCIYQSKFIIIRLLKQNVQKNRFKNLPIERALAKMTAERMNTISEALFKNATSLLIKN